VPTFRVQAGRLYTVSGGVLGPEAEIGELSGYYGSRPVRVGNAAAHQVQLDVFGPIVDLVALLLEKDAPVSGEHWRLVRAMVEAVRARWHEPDHGIWEIRRPGRRPHRTAARPRALIPAGRNPVCRSS
jgi:trehalose 6-phosphate phosphatase